MSDWVEEVDIGGDRYGLKDLQTEATANQNKEDIEEMKEAADYSTTEHLTGRKWLDGRPTYEKIVSFGALPNSTTKSVSANIQNLRIICKISALAFSQGGASVRPLPILTTSGTGFAFLYTDSDSIKVFSNIDLSAYSETYITIEYTKSTDTPQP